MRATPARTDPVMGGKSSSTFTVERNLGVFAGVVRIVPSLKAAGFCNAQTEGVQVFPDINSSDAIGFKMQLLL